MTTAFWPAARREFVFCAREYLSPQEFAAMRTVEGTINFNAPPYTRCKALITQPSPGNYKPWKRWHVVERQFSFGVTIYFASAIVIRLPAHTEGEAR